MGNHRGLALAAGSVAVAMVLGSAAMVSAQAPAPESQRQGFTFLLSLGAGMQGGLDDALDYEIGLAGLNVGLGGFLSPELAILGRISGTFTARESSAGFEDVDFTVLHGFVGPSVMFFLSDRFSLEAGVGLGIVNGEATAETDLGRITVSNSDEGLGVLLGAAAPLTYLGGGGYALTLGTDVNLGFFEDGTMLSVGLLLGIQGY